MNFCPNLCLFFVKFLHYWTSPVTLPGWRIKDKHPLQRNASSVRAWIILLCWKVFQSSFQKSFLHFISEGTSKNQYFKRNFEKKVQYNFSEPDMLCSRTSFSSSQARGGITAVVLQELGATENRSTADERNWKSGSNVLHALHIAWLMGHMADILLVKLEKCLSLHFILKSLNLAFVTTLKTVRVILLGIRIHKEQSRLYNVHFSCKQINSKQSLI